MRDASDLPRPAGPLVLRAPRKNAVMFAVTSLIPAALLGALTLRAWTAGRTGSFGIAGGVLATAVALGVAAYLFAYAFRACLLVHDTGIERVGVFRRRVVGWVNVAKIAFNPHHHWFFVTAANGARLWLPADVTGAAQFARVALRRLPPAVLAADADVREVLEELAAEGP
jgi:hypothetical protein